MLTVVAVPEAFRSVKLCIKNTQSVPCRLCYKTDLHLIKKVKKFYITTTVITQPWQTFRGITRQPLRGKYLSYTYMPHSVAQVLIVKIHTDFPSGLRFNI